MFCEGLVVDGRGRKRAPLARSSRIDLDPIKMYIHTFQSHSTPKLHKHDCF